MEELQWGSVVRSAAVVGSCAFGAGSEHIAPRPDAFLRCGSSEVSTDSEEEFSTSDAGSTTQERRTSFTKHVLWLGGRRIEVSPDLALRSGCILAGEDEERNVVKEETLVMAPLSTCPAGTSGARPGLLDQDDLLQKLSQLHSHQMRDSPLQAGPQRGGSPGDRRRQDASVQAGAPPANKTSHESVSSEEEEASEDDMAQPGRAGGEAAELVAKMFGSDAAELQEKVASGQAQLPSGVPSVGSLLHGTPQCRPCFYAHVRKGCRFGAACLFCHEVHAKKRKPRPPKHVRVDCKNAAKAAFQELSGVSPQEAEAWVQRQSAEHEQDEKTTDYTLAVLRALFRSQAGPADASSTTESSEPAHDRPAAAAPSSGASSGSSTPTRQIAPAEKAVPMPAAFK